MLRRPLADMARRAGLLAVAGLLMSIGLGFAVLALWLGLERWGGPLVASWVMAVGFVGLGLILIVVSQHRAPRSRAPGVPELTEAFLLGLQAARKFRRK